ncbi:hypothetical protein [Chrysiogenes arsenatis]|uniref:hypothetical protein n=1 Tax=Chrysiogenes arsenatis TaxID=309797 RepID=UPI001268704F|nr:hypothetical protein [Chrysiogenes arsenatis]
MIATPLQKILLAATAMAFLLILSSCAARPSPVVVIPADRMITPLASGNYEVTPAWLLERYDYERWLTDELADCKRGK